MPSYKEIRYVEEISKQLDDIEPTLDKMNQLSGAFTLQSVGVATLGTKAHAIKSKLYIAIKTLADIEKREVLLEKLPEDGFTKNQMTMSILNQLKNYQDFLKDYQKLVGELLDKKDDIEKKVAEKRQKGEPVPSEAETKDALEEAKTKYQEAVKEKSFLGKTFQAITSFYEKAKPYVEPLIGVAKILLKFL